MKPEYVSRPASSSNDWQAPSEIDKAIALLLENGYGIKKDGAWIAANYLTIIKSIQQ